MHFPFRLPPPPGVNIAPEWVGNRFIVADTPVSVLAYECGVSGWTDELTDIHEEEAGEDHYIDRASRLEALRQLNRWIETTSTPVIMDVGCSSGLFLKLLKSQMPKAYVIGSDYVRGPLEHLACSMPDTPLVQFNLVTCPLPSESFDALVLLNVLEHIEDDAAAVRQVFRLLRPGGIAVLEVPAGPHLFDIYDRQLMHHRRYRMPELLTLLKTSGFEILSRSHLGFVLYPAFYLVKKRNQRLLGSDMALQRSEVRRSISRGRDSRLFHTIMELESALRRLVYLPTGIRCLVTCRRPLNHANQIANER